jgi:outer membrane protein assembly factor BamB
MSLPLRAIVAVIVVGTVATGICTAARGADWPTFDGNASRSAWLNVDRSVNRQNVKLLRRHWVTMLDTVADSTPILVEHVPGRTAPMLFQTDRAGTTYGIDASTGSIVWRFRTSGPKITTSTPVLDPGGSAIYVPGLDGYVRKVATATGTEITAPGFPAQITLMTQLEKDASPLNVANGYLYAVTSGYIGDAPPYDGHVVVVRLSDGNTRVFNSLCSNLHMLLRGSGCSSVRAGSWARAGVVVDPDPSMNGRVYFATGNGTFNVSQHDYGDSVIALSADGSSMPDSFTPTDYLRLANLDLDLGSTAPAMLPSITGSLTPLLAVQGGKGKVLYLLDRTRLGGVGGELQDVALPRELISAPAVWRDGANRVWIFLGTSPVTALTVVTNGQGQTRLQHAWSASVGGTSPVATDGLVFVASSNVVNALDSRSGKALWSSTSSGVGGTIGSIHWQSPIVVDGGVYISDNAQHLTAYTINGV